MLSWATGAEANPPGKPARRPADATITPDLAEFLHSGLIMFLATRSADLAPSSVIASGLRVDGPQRVTVFVALAVGAPAPVFGNLADNGEMAVTLSNVLDHRSIQIKGRAAGRRPRQRGRSGVPGAIHGTAAAPR